VDSKPARITTTTDLVICVLQNPRFYINTIRNSPRIEENRHNHSSVSWLSHSPLSLLSSLSTDCDDGRTGSLSVMRRI
jgi:hypothetical protein